VQCRTCITLYQVIFPEPLCAVGRAYSNAYFGAGSGPIFLDDVQCTSSSTQLLECFSRPLLSHNCLHSADAGVKCEGIIFKLFYKEMLPDTAFQCIQIHVQLVSYD